MCWANSVVFGNTELFFRQDRETVRRKSLKAVTRTNMVVLKQTRSRATATFRDVKSARRCLVVVEALELEMSCGGHKQVTTANRSLTRVRLVQNESSRVDVRLKTIFRNVVESFGGQDKRVWILRRLEQATIINTVENLKFWVYLNRFDRAIMTLYLGV